MEWEDGGSGATIMETADVPNLLKGLISWQT